jgi:hypothetical protein
MSLYNPSIFGTFASNPSGGGGASPGGPNLSLQINDNGNFNGNNDGIYVPGSGYQINNVILDSSGTGNLFLNDQGNYVSVSSQDNLFASQSDGTSGDIFFIFPTNIAESLNIQFNGSQVILVNGSATELIYYSYTSEFYFPSMPGFPAINQEFTQTLSTSSNTLFDSGIGYDLTNEINAYEKVYVSLRSSILQIDTFLSFTCYSNQIVDFGIIYQCNGKYDVFSSPLNSKIMRKVK